MPNPLVVYLDQNAWIHLTRSYNGKDNDQQIKRALEAVLFASDSGKALFPLSIVHLSETLSHLTFEKRKRLCEFMIRVSKESTMLPFAAIMKTEIRQAVYRKIGRPTIALKTRVIGKGIPHLYASKIELIKKNPNAPDLPLEVRKKLLERGKSLKTLLLAINQETAEFYHAERKIEEQVLEQLEENRARDNRITNTDERYRVAAARFLWNHITPELARMVTFNGINKDAIMSDNDTREDIEQLFQNIPTAYVLFSLVFKRDIQKYRKIQKNDLNDISYLSIALPYCDIVVTEKFWSNLAKQAKLDAIYKTKILSSIIDLPKHLCTKQIFIYLLF